MHYKETNSHRKCCNTDFRRFSEQKLARHGEVKEEQVFFWGGGGGGGGLRRRRSQVKMEEVSFQASFENCQGLSIPYRGGKFIPPARNDE